MTSSGKPRIDPSQTTPRSAQPGETAPVDQDDPTPRDLDLKNAPLPDDDEVSHHAASIPASLSDGPFGTLLEPVLRQVCEGRLSPVSWFRADWQRGGAVTGYAKYKDDDGEPHEVVVKMPIPPCERHWLVALQSHDHIVPHVYAHGETLGGYDLAWVVMERLPHGPLSHAWEGAEFDLLVEAVCRFYRVAAEHPLQGEPHRRDWEKILDRARSHVSSGAVRDQSRWNKALKAAQKQLPDWLEVWDNRPTEHWCHGDLHLGNAMTRTPAPQGPALLLDFALVRVGHWVDDAVYFEHLYWSRRKRLGGRRLCKQIAQQRKKLGLPVAPDWSDYASVKRALLAMATPAMLDHDGGPAQVAAALEVLERELG